MNDIDKSLNDLFNSLDNDETIKTIKKLSIMINQDIELTSLIKEFKEASLNNLDNQKLINIKAKLFNNKIYKEYIEASNNLLYFIMYFNKSLSSIVSFKQCRL
ncbi:MAG: YlbF family regulator [Bacilli bacterium]|nr:YlbF family regulator [Bacilli bacterium]